MTTIHGFSLLRELDIPELHSHARLFRHDKTGAELLSLENDDENKCFGVAFRTPPADSTGVAHILEHAVLAGSRKYPLKDPFAELLKGSVKTFLNAFTYPDMTCYPVASQNAQDFYNLVDVYLDTVFYPLLRKQTFQQQGWHYELEQADAPLIYKGVVFNEMKGVYGSPDAVLGRYTRRSLFPDTTYGVDSGGDPTNIPDLSYEQFAAFHRAYYHPSNARICFYGDDDPTERLRILDEYLRDFDAATPNSSITLQRPFSAPRSVTHAYASSDDTAKSMVNVAWMFDGGSDPATTLALNILEHILVGTSAAPLRKALIDSGLGESLTGSGLMEMRQMVFTVGLKGIVTDNAGAVEALILDTLQTLVRDGIDPETIAASLNTVEFALRENNTGSFPRGLSIWLRSLSTWLYDGDPFESLLFEAPLAEVKNKIAAGDKLFESLIQQHLLDNPHRVTLLLQPDPKLGAAIADAEQARLDAERAKMSDDDIAEIIDTTQLLKTIQATPDDPKAIAAIPTLKLSDLEREIKTLPIEVEDHGGVPVLFHDLFTSGVVYFEALFDLHRLPQDLLPYVPIFTRALFQVGTQNEDYVRIAQRIGQNTGGLGASSFTTHHHHQETAVAKLMIRGKSTLDQAEAMLDIVRDVLLTVRLDNQERVRQLVLEQKASKEAGLIPGGHGVVAARLASRYSEASWASELMGGIDGLFFLRQLAEQVENDWPSVLARLEAIRVALLQRGGMLCNVTVDAAGWQRFAPQLDAFIAAMPAEHGTTATWTWTPAPGNEGLIIPAQVNYVGKGGNLRDLGYNATGAASVIIRYLRTTWLWDQVRVQGGAYGGFATFDRDTGVFSFLSYRDPNLLETLDVYDRTAAWMRDTPPDDLALTRSIIGVVGDMDGYQLPDAKGHTSMMRYLTGRTDAERQQTRDEILATSSADFRAFADILDQLREHGSIVVLGGAQAVEAAAAEIPGGLRLVKVM